MIPSAIILATGGIWLFMISSPGANFGFFWFETVLSETGSIVVRVLDALVVLFAVKTFPFVYRVFKSDFVNTVISDKGIEAKHGFWKKPIPWTAISDYTLEKRIAGAYIRLNLKGDRNGEYVKSFFGFKSPPYIDVSILTAKLEDVTKILDKYTQPASSQLSKD